MKAIPSSSLSKGLLVALIGDMTREVGNVAQGLQIGLTVLLFQKRSPFFVGRIAKVPLNWSGTKHRTILDRL
jgi:hypothetical protein